MPKVAYDRLGDYWLTRQPPRQALRQGRQGWLEQLIGASKGILKFWTA